MDESGTEQRSAVRHNVMMSSSLQLPPGAGFTPTPSNLPSTTVDQMETITAPVPFLLSWMFLYTIDG